MRSSHTRSTVSRNCKGCGERFTVTGDTITSDLARGLSKPARCPKCRKSHGRFVNSVGSGYFLEKRMGTPHPQCMGKFGLALLDHPEPKVEESSYEVEPSPEQLEKFKVLEPAVKALIGNLEDPNGTKVSILVGPTGTGKSVWAPTQLLRSSIGREGRICVTQPRLVTLRTPKGKSVDATTPGFVAKSLLGADSVGAGQEVGLLYSGEGTMSDRYTRLLYVTDGILIRWILNGQLGRFNVIMIDEAHEQSANMELIFALMRYHLPLYPRLRLVIMSATMDVQRFANFFGDGSPESVFVAAPEQPKTLCKIFDRWPDGDDGYAKNISGLKLPESPQEIPKAIAKVIDAIRTKEGFTRLGNPRGDILCFVPTVRLVEETVEAIQKLSGSKLEVHPCHAQTEEKEVAALQKSEVHARKAMEQGNDTPTQRVIVATNYAETSVTFANLRYVIDSGYIMEPVWDPTTSSMDYPTRRHSQAGCIQRKGRVGRVQDGEVFRLYTEEDFGNPEVFPPNPRAAIAREPLEKFLLAAKAAGVADLEGFQWLGFDPTDELQTGERARSLSSLSRHGVVDKEGDITSRGLELEGVRHASLDWSRAMSESDSMACALEVATFLAFSELQKAPFLKGELGLLALARWQRGCADDLELYLRLFFHWSKAAEGKSPEEHREWSETQGLNHKAFKEVKRARKEALLEFAQRTHTDLTERALDLNRIERTRWVLTRALRHWVFVKSADSDGSFVPFDAEACPCKDKLWIDQDSACENLDSVKAFLCVSRNRYKDRVFGQHIIRVRPDWIANVDHDSEVLLALRASGALVLEKDKEDWESGGSVRIQNQIEEPLLPKAFKIGELKKFRVRRFRRDKERHLVLADEQESGLPVILSLEGGFMEKGEIFRAHVDQVGDELKLGVTQRKLIASQYPEGRTFSLRNLELVRAIREDKEDPESPVKGHIFKLEPGIEAVLFRHPNEKFWRHWEEYLEGAFSQLRVLKNENGRIKLALKFPELEQGKVYSGSVQKILCHKDSSDAFGFLVSLFPGKTGMVHRKSLDDQSVLGLYSEGEDVKVRVTEISSKDGRTRYELTLTSPKKKSKFPFFA